MQDERRVYLRKLVCIPCRIQIGDDSHSGRSYDLSDHGAAVITETRLDSSLRCRIQFLWIDGRSSELEGRVRYSRPIHEGHEFLSGVSFVQTPDDSVQQLLSQF